MFFIRVAEVPLKNSLLPAGLFFTDSALFYHFSILRTLSLVFLWKNFLAIKKNSSPSWKSLFPVEVNYFIRGTNLSNQLVVCYVWREFSSVWRDMMKEDLGVQELKIWDAPNTPNKYSWRLKRLSLGMPPCIPFFINNHQFVLLNAIFLSLHVLCAILGASCIYF